MRVDKGLQGIRTNIRRESDLMTDAAQWYKRLGKEFASHGMVHHEKEEYVRGQIHTNTVEGYYIFKRGIDLTDAAAKGRPFFPSAHSATFCRAFNIGLRLLKIFWTALSQRPGGLEFGWTGKRETVTFGP
jgi:hypothetical protein